jgi:hypothetical protein
VDDYDEYEFKRDTRRSKTSSVRRTASSANSRSSKSKSRGAAPVPRAPPKPVGCIVTIVYLGSSVSIPYDTQTFSPKDRISIYQQHCGGENLMVYSGMHEPGGRFFFYS